MYIYIFCSTPTSHQGLIKWTVKWSHQSTAWNISGVCAYRPRPPWSDWHHLGQATIYEECWSFCLCSQLEIIELLAVKLLQCLVCLAFKAGSQRHCFGGLELLVSRNVLMLLPARDRNCKTHKTRWSKLSFPCLTLPWREFVHFRKVVAMGKLASKDGELSWVFHSLQSRYKAVTIIILNHYNIL